MVLCFIALGAFAIMSIFSAKYRPYAKEAFNCVIKKATLRKCDSDLDLKIKAEIVGKLMAVNKGLAGLANRHFVLLSWLFTLLMLGSFAYSAVSVYNYVVYGNCNGPESTEICLFDPEATGPNGFSRSGAAAELSYPPTLKGHMFGNPDAEVVLIEYGCFSCPYTQKSEQGAERIRNEYADRITFVYKTIPVDRHPYSWEASNAAECADEQGKYWEYRKILFDNQQEFKTGGIPKLKQLAVGLVPNTQQFNRCIDSNKYMGKVNETYVEGHAIGIYGTPTFFIGDKHFVGNTEYQKLKDAIELELNN